MSALLALGLLGGALAADPGTCAEPAPVSGSVQVAWVSRVDRTVGPNSSIEVVRVSDLRAWIRDEQPDALRLAQGLGMVRAKARADGPVGDRAYKVVVFDVQASQLCRPMTDLEPGTPVGGVAVCEDGDQRSVRGHRKGWTGCGYAMDTLDADRGPDVFRISWEAASAQGFCLFPLQRFLDGA